MNYRVFLISTAIKLLPQYIPPSADADVTKARVCQMIALCKRLPKEITEFIVDTHEPEILRQFSERRIRPLTLLASDEDKIKKCDGMMEALSTLVQVKASATLS
jgi:hypothetical protein